MMTHWSALACVLALLIAGPSVAATIDPAARVDLSVTEGGMGLDGAFWDTGRLRNLAEAEAAMAMGPADARFRALVLDYPNGSRNTVNDRKSDLADFLGDYATELTGDLADDLTGSVFHFTGYIHIPAPGTYRFRLASDDGSSLKIGGETVAEYSRLRGFRHTDGTASFAATGLYAFDLTFFENGGNTGLELSSDLPGGPGSALAMLGGASLFSQAQVDALLLAQSSSLSAFAAADAVPAPAGLALFLGGLALLRRR